MQYTLDTEDLRSKLAHGDHIKLALLRQFKSLEPLTQALKNYPEGVFFTILKELIRPNKSH